MRTLLSILLLLAFVLPMAGDRRGILLSKKPEASGGGGGGPTLVAQDDFDSYANTQDLGTAANWEVAGGTDSANISNLGGDGSVFNQAANSLYEWVGAGSFNSDQRAEATIDTATGGAFEWIGITVRVQTGVQTGYWLMCSSTDLFLYSFNAGTPTLIISDAAMSFSAGHRIALEASGAGTATRLKVQIDTGSGWTDKWTNQNPPDDIDGGKPGVGGGSSGVLGMRIDDWKGYNL